MDSWAFRAITVHFYFFRSSWRWNQIFTTESYFWICGNWHRLILTLLRSNVSRLSMKCITTMASMTIPSSETKLKANQSFSSNPLWSDATSSNFISKCPAMEDGAWGPLYGRRARRDSESFFIFQLIISLALFSRVSLFVLWWLRQLITREKCFSSCFVCSSVHILGSTRKRRAQLTRRMINCF